MQQEEKQTKETVRGLVSVIERSQVLTQSQMRLLDHLERKFPHGFEEADLALALGRDANWDKRRTDIRALVARLREKLDDFYRYTPLGKAAPVRLNLPKGTPYAIRLIENRHELDDAEHFWDAHFGQNNKNLIIYTEPLFFWDKHNRCYIRFLDINSDRPEVDAQQIRASIPKNHPAHQLEPCFHYQSAGETQAQRILRKWFEQQDNKVRVEVSRECVEAWVWDYNLVILGNARSNRFLRELQDGLAMVLRDDRITVRRTPEDKRPSEIEDLIPSTTRPGAYYVHAIVTRGLGRAQHRCVTLIAANHGRAIEKVAEFLTNPDNLKQLYRDLRLDPGEPLPLTFQWLFRLKLLNHELIVGEPELIESAPAAIDGTEPIV
jgi:hypothetical protein